MAQVPEDLKDLTWREIGMAQITGQNKLMRKQPMSDLTEVERRVWEHIHNAKPERVIPFRI